MRQNIFLRIESGNGGRQERTVSPSPQKDIRHHNLSSETSIRRAIDSRRSPKLHSSQPSRQAHVSKTRQMINGFIMRKIPCTRPLPCPALLGTRYQILELPFGTPWALQSVILVLWDFIFVPITYLSHHSRWTAPERGKPTVAEGARYRIKARAQSSRDATPDQTDSGSRVSRPAKQLPSVSVQLQCAFGVRGRVHKKRPKRRPEDGREIMFHKLYYCHISTAVHCVRH